MYRTSSDFQAFLEAKLGTRNVYFQQPASVQMKYPAFRFNISDITNQHADNIHYFQRTAYNLTYITEDADDPMVQEIAKWQYCKYDRWYASGNLNHYVYTIFF